MKKIIFLLTLALLLVGCQSNESNNNDVVKENLREELVINSVEDIDRAIAEMTIEEKAGQLIQAELKGIMDYEIAEYNIGSILSGGGSTPSVNTPQGWIDMYNKKQEYSRNSSTGIPIIYGIDAVHGHNNLENAVIFPHNIGLGAANDNVLMEKIGAEVAKEMNATGLNWNFSPAVSIVQDIRWGRTYESYSEDPNRVKGLAASYIKGQQAEGIITTTKHFIGDGYTEFGTGEGENLIDRGDVTVSKQKLLDIYLPPYEAAIKAGTKSIMVSFNSVNGLRMHEHKELLIDVLRNELKFEGVVISDWEAIHALPGTLKQQVASSINAGVDMLMQPYNWLDVYNAIVANVKSGEITEERLNESVKRILIMKFEAGLFDENWKKEPGSIGNENTRRVARDAVSQSLVLLKNNNDVLPLSKNLKIYLTGPASDNVGIQSGGWTSTWQGEMKENLNNGTSIVDAFNLVLDKNGGKLVDNPEDADVIVLAIGEQPYAEMKGDTADLSLTGALSLMKNLETVREVSKSDKPVVTLIIAGRPLLINDYINEWDSLVMAWLPGTEGLGITDVLFGDKNFSGTLPVTWPMFNEQASDSMINEKYDEIEHLFKYGYGLSY